MTSAPADQELRARLQAVQDELAQKYNVAIVIRDCQGQPLTAPSKSLQLKISLSPTALQGLYHCLSANWLVRDEEVLRGQRILATLFSGGVALAVIPVAVDSTVAAVVRVAQTFGDVGRRLELLNEEIVESGGAVPGADVLDSVDIQLGAEFLAMVEAVQDAVGAALSGTPAPSPAAAAATCLPFSARVLDTIPAGVFVTTLDWQICAANRELARMLGFADGQALVGRNLLGEVLCIECLPLVEELQAKDALTDRQATLRTAEGGQLQVVLSMAVIEGQGGEPAAYWGLARSVRAEERRPTAASIGAAPLEVLLKEWPAPAILADRTQHIIGHSKAVEEELGFSAEELSGAHVLKVIEGTEAFFEVEPHGAKLVELALFRKGGDGVTARCVVIPAPETVLVLALPAPRGGIGVTRATETSLVDVLPVAAALCTSEGRVRLANRALAALTGFAEEELRGKMLAQLLTEGGAAQLATCLEGAVAQEEAHARMTLRRKDGGEVPVEVRMRAPRGQAETTDVVVIVLEVATEGAAEINQKYRQLVETTRDLYWAIEIPDPEHFELAVPLHFSKGLAYIPDLATLQAEGGLLRVKITHTPESWETFRRSCLAVYRTQRVMSGVRTLHVDRAGNVTQALVNEIFPLYREGKLVGVHGLARDITQEYLLQQELRRSGEHAQALLEHAAVGFCLVGPQGEVLHINRRGLEILGASSREELNRQGATTLVEGQVGESLARALSRSKVSARPITATRLDGRKVQLLVLARNIAMADLGECVEVWFTDISHHRRAEQRLRQSEQRFRSFAENIAEGVVMTNEVGEMVYANRRVAELFGYSRKELAGMALWGLLHPTEREAVQGLFTQLMRGEATGVHIEVDGQTKGASHLRLEVSLTPRRKRGKVVGAFVVLRDITQQRSLEEQLQQAQKMESIGMLAGGIAHDFNNVLTEILGYASLLDAEEELPAHLRGMVAQIIELASMAGSLTQQLMTFSRTTKPQRRPMQLNEVVRETARLLSHSMPEGIAIRTHLAKELRHVSGDPVQLQQVLINLCVNARDAMAEGGKILIKTDNMTLSDEQRRHFKNQQLREVVRLRVSDTGVGMDQETLKHIFEPFFTTKAKGKGSGLGLSIVYAIVAAHEGEIQVSSAPGQGATFDIYLPALAGQVGQEQDEERLPLAGGSECVLLVDDQEEILALGQRMLSRYGYRVLAAKGGAEGVELFRQRAGEIDLVILDVLMPDMAGEECARRMRAIRPEVAILLTSGYVPAPRGQAELAQVSDGMLQKPFDLSQLLHMVRTTLDAKKTERGAQAGNSSSQ
ncbi:MAG: PAS domain S-box protein [Candidatus Oleimicrobiaceae bacterium]